MFKRLIFILLFVFCVVSQAEESNRYSLNIDYTFKVGNRRDISRLGILVPVQEYNSGLLFSNIFGLRDTRDSSEINLGFGYRELFKKSIIGGVVFYDKRKSNTGNIFSQLTFSLEYFRRYLEFRLNGYAPIGKISKPSESSRTYTPKSYLKTTRKGFVTEKALWGYDVELGGNLPSLERLTGFVAYYHFNDNDIKAIHGVRYRCGFKLNEYLSLEGEIAHDRLRNINYLAGVRIHLTIGGKSNNQLSSLERKMTQMVIRDIDIITDKVKDSFEFDTSKPIEYEVDWYENGTFVDADESEVKVEFDDDGIPVRVNFPGARKPLGFLREVEQRNNFRNTNRPRYRGVDDLEIRGILNNSETSFNNALKVLGLSKKTTIRDVKKAYRKLSKKHHPDRGGNGDDFNCLREAYEIIMSLYNKDVDKFINVIRKSSHKQEFTFVPSWFGASFTSGKKTNYTPKPMLALSLYPHTIRSKDISGQGMSDNFVGIEFEDSKTARLIGKNGSVNLDSNYIKGIPQGLSKGQLVKFIQNSRFNINPQLSNNNAVIGYSVDVVGRLRGGMFGGKDYRGSKDYNIRPERNPMSSGGFQPRNNNGSFGGGGPEDIRRTKESWWFGNNNPHQNFNGTPSPEGRTQFLSQIHGYYRIGDTDYVRWADGSSVKFITYGNSSGEIFSSPETEGQYIHFRTALAPARNRKGPQAYHGGGKFWYYDRFLEYLSSKNISPTAARDNLVNLFNNWKKEVPNPIPHIQEKRQNFASAKSKYTKFMQNTKDIKQQLFEGTRLLKESRKKLYDVLNQLSYKEDMKNAYGHLKPEFNDFVNSMQKHRKLSISYMEKIRKEMQQQLSTGIGVPPKDNTNIYHKLQEAYLAVNVGMGDKLQQQIDKVYKGIWDEYTEGMRKNRNNPDYAKKRWDEIRRERIKPILDQRAKQATKDNQQFHQKFDAKLKKLNEFITTSDLSQREYDKKYSELEQSVQGVLTETLKTTHAFSIGDENKQDFKKVLESLKQASKRHREMSRQKYDREIKQAQQKRIQEQQKRKQEYEQRKNQKTLDFINKHSDLVFDELSVDKSIQAANALGCLEPFLEQERNFKKHNSGKPFVPPQVRIITFTGSINRAFPNPTIEDKQSSLYKALEEFKVIAASNTSLYDNFFPTIEQLAQKHKKQRESVESKEQHNEVAPNLNNNSNQYDELVKLQKTSSTKVDQELEREIKRDFETKMKREEESLESQGNDGNPHSVPYMQKLGYQIATSVASMLTKTADAKMLSNAIKIGNSSTLGVLGGGKPVMGGSSELEQVATKKVNEYAEIYNVSKEVLFKYFTTAWFSPISQLSDKLLDGYQPHKDTGDTKRVSPIQKDIGVNKTISWQQDSKDSVESFTGFPIQQQQINSTTSNKPNVEDNSLLMQENFKATSPIWQGLKPFRGAIKTNGLSGNKKEYYKWDFNHSGEIEAYNHDGEHIGVICPKTGQKIKPAKKGRNIKGEL
ncbi:MAG: inverse autotransporter beta domain-containing protein [Legionellales bacterium]|nr:inverse autotransporter beta domain-containing protein [Legionellales bacterium]